jgi:Kef-type K+ transport system membrane component KefB
MSGSIFQFSSLLTVFRAEAGDVTEIVTRLLIQLAVILFAAKLAGEIATRYLKLPSVLAELGAGVIIGPFALGGIAIPGFGPLFPAPEVDGVPAVIPVSNELFALAQLGSIFLLFAIGLETNLRQFLRYAGPATAVALGDWYCPLH